MKWKNFKILLLFFVTSFSNLIIIINKKLLLLSYRHTWRASWSTAQERRIFYDQEIVTVSLSLRNKFASFPSTFSKTRRKKKTQQVLREIVFFSVFLKWEQLINRWGWTSWPENSESLSTMSSLFLLGTTRLSTFLVPLTPKVIHHPSHFYPWFCCWTNFNVFFLQNKRNWFDHLKGIKLNKVVSGGYIYVVLSN